MFAVKEKFVFRLPAVAREIVAPKLVHKAGGKVVRRRFNKLSCAGWLPHFRCSVSGLPQS